MPTLSSLREFLKNIQLPPMSANKTYLFEKRVFISAPPEKIWDYITDSDIIPMWNEDVEEICMPDFPSHHEEDAIGNLIRVYRKDGGTHAQIITDWLPNRVFGYITRDNLKLHNTDIELHIGLFKLFESADGTEIQWYNYFEFPNQRSAANLIYQLDRQFRRSLIYLKWQAEFTQQQVYCQAV
jgi:hypothetical protein